jgi:hypothetical protein
MPGLALCSNGVFERAEEDTTRSEKRMKPTFRFARLIGYDDQLASPFRNAIE